MKSLLRRCWRAIAAHPWRAACGAAALLYLLLLLPLVTDVWYSDRRSTEDWIAATKARRGAPLEPLPMLVFPEKQEIPFLRDPFEPLYAPQPSATAAATAPPEPARRGAGPDSAGDAPDALAAVRFIRSDIDLDQPFVIARSGTGDLYRLRKGDRVNGGTLVDIGPARVVVDRAGRVQEYPLQTEN